jgi:CelD/BcsL family acetyltransferase involved in cellulose biosynthesis
VGQPFRRGTGVARSPFLKAQALWAKDWAEGIGTDAMLEAQTLHPQELSPTDAERWRALCAAWPAFASPLLGPDFAQAVGTVRADARVAIFRRDGRGVGFLPFHRRPGGLARPIGAPLSDYHALVSARNAAITGPEALAAADLAAFRFTGLVDPFEVFRPASRQDAYRVVLGGTALAHLETVRAASAKKFKNYRRLDHKLARDLGPIRILAPDDDRETFARLSAWKRDQLRRTGTHDFLAAEWTRHLFERLFARRTGPFRGLMITLHAGDRLVAGHFGVRLDGVYHPWLAAADPELGAYSPGQLFLARAIAAMPDLGLTTYDLGPGHDHYKRAYGRTRLKIGEGLAAAASSAGASARRRELAWSLAGAHRGGAAASLRRRLDAIATVELGFAGRALGFVQALADQTRHSAPAEDL